VTWQRFEALVASLLTRDGFEVLLGPSTNDSGLDIIASRQTTLGNVVYGVRCRQGRRSVGASEVRALAGAVAHDSLTAGVIVTTSRFTRDAVREAGHFPYNIALIGAVELSRWIRDTPIL
jgi:restriction system protein